MKRLLIIAGSDSGGGAGIQADIKTASAFGVYAMTAVTAVTVQNTKGVKAIHSVPPAVVAEQIAATLSDIGADAIKIGMLGNAATVKAVASALKKHAK
ncbi:MAG: bifunctional hydroxymethylpyrimidine kinase/phosphomethylpyrimidine kinase, partial [Rhizomicrobium sp.]